MSVRAGIAAAGWNGIIREGGVPIWICDHTHEKREDAKVCSAEEMRLRRATA